jgi:hypothetical protein
VVKAVFYDYIFMGNEKNDLKKTTRKKTRKKVVKLKNEKSQTT